jgi:hypothetical protein
MHKLITVVFAGLLCISVAQAQDKKPDKKATTPAAPKISDALIKKMRDCRANAEKKQLVGDERKLFVSRCIDGSDAAPRIAAAKAEERAREKSATCIKTAMARGLKGEERKKFLSGCQKG